MLLRWFLKRSFVGFDLTNKGILFQKRVPISQYQKYLNTLFVYPRVCISIVFIFSWDLQWTQEKLETMLMQNFGETDKEYYGIFDIG